MTIPDHRDILADFLATRDPRQPDSERIGTPEAYRNWLLRRNLITQEDLVTLVDAGNARRVRAALRSFLAAEAGAPVDPRTGPTLSAVTSYAPLRLTVGDTSGIQLQPAVGGAAGALGRIVAALFLAAANGSLARLKVCKSCGFPFYDQSKNRSRVWCSMERCGSHNKSRAYEERKRARTVPAHSPTEAGK